jgi:hypothetical protein
VSGALAQTKYKIIPIQTSGGSTSSALSLNQNGHVVGYSFQGEDYKTFLVVGDRRGSSVGSDVVSGAHATRFC